MGLNDLRDDYLDGLFDLRKQAENAAEEIIDEYGNDLTLLRDSYADYARKTTELANRYYANVRDLWDTLADVDMPAFSGVSVDSDEAAWKQFGGINNTDHTGYTYDEIKTGRNKAGLDIDDMWDLGVRNLDSDGLRKLAGQIVRHTARLTIENSAAADPTRPRYARVPSGPKTCAFCTMLASRGFAYSTEKTAGGEDEKYHDSCDCMIIPSWGKTNIKGYDPNKYRQMYETAKSRVGSTDAKKIAQWMRHMYARNLTDGAEPKKNRASFSLEKAFTGMRGERSLSKRAWDKRQKALGIPLDWDVLEMHEITFMERFASLGNHYEWIPKDDSSEHKPTNDFHWVEMGLDVEIKGTKKQHPRCDTFAKSISRAVMKAARKGVVKDSFILDASGSKIAEKELIRLAEYNVRHPDARIAHLFYFDDNSGGVKEIDLK